MDRKPEEKLQKTNPQRKKKAECACESCIYYDMENDDCRVALDEDELLRFSFRRTGDCPYYKYYDEYKSVRKQN